MPHARRSPLSPSLPASPSLPLPLLRNRLSSAVLRALSPLSLPLQQVRAPGRRAVSGAPEPWLSCSHLLSLGVCVSSAAFIRLRANSPEEQPPRPSDPSFWAPLPARAAASAQSVGMLCTLEGPSSSRAWGVLLFFC